MIFVWVGVETLQRARQSAGVPLSRRSLSRGWWGGGVWSGPGERGARTRPRPPEPPETSPGAPRPHPCSPRIPPRDLDKRRPSGGPARGGRPIRTTPGERDVARAAAAAGWGREGRRRPLGTGLGRRGDGLGRSGGRGWAHKRMTKGWWRVRRRGAAEKGGTRAVRRRGAKRPRARAPALSLTAPARGASCRAARAASAGRLGRRQRGRGLPPRSARSPETASRARRRRPRRRAGCGRTLPGR